jgi:hypothetical protein
MLAHVLAASLALVPCEYAVDCGPAAVPFKYKMELELRARDGTSLSLPIITTADWDPKGSPDDLIILLRREGWVARSGPGNSFVVMRTLKGSPVWSVTVKSEAEWPKVRWVPRPPAKEPKK